MSWNCHFEIDENFIPENGTVYVIPKKKLHLLKIDLIMKLILLFVSAISLNLCYGQNDWLTFPNTEKDSIKVDSIQYLDFNSITQGNIVVYKDARVAEITEFVGRNKESIEGTKIDGYRLQIFFAESKNEAQSQKAGFISSHSEHKAYIDYLAPNYRVRVGNFRTKLQAEKFKQELISVYPTCIVLEDKIELPIITVIE